MDIATEIEKMAYAELPDEFDGRAQQSGWKFRKIRQTDYGYVYEKSSDDVSHTYYEVFSRKTRPQQERTFPNGTNKVWPASVVYPGDNAFGDWAWCCGSLDRALEILESLKTK